MVTLQRLPVMSILLTDIGGKVFLQEHPAPTDPGGGNESRGGALPEGGRMQLEEGGSLVEIECEHRHGVSRRSG